MSGSKKKSDEWDPFRLPGLPQKQVPISYFDPPLYRIQPYDVAKGVFFKHSNDNRFSTKKAPCCYLSDDYETAFREAMHYLIKMASSAKKKKYGRPVINSEVLKQKGVWSVHLKQKINLIDLTVPDARNRFQIDYHPGYEPDYSKVRKFAKTIRDYAAKQKHLEIMGFYYPTQNDGKAAIAVWEDAIDLLEAGQWNKTTLWDVIQPFKEEIAEDFYISISDFPKSNK